MRGTTSQPSNSNTLHSENDSISKRMCLSARNNLRPLSSISWAVKRASALSVSMSSCQMSRLLWHFRYLQTSTWLTPKSLAILMKTTCFVSIFHLGGFSYWQAIWATVAWYIRMQLTSSTGKATQVSLSAAQIWTNIFIHFYLLLRHARKPTTSSSFSLRCKLDVSFSSYHLLHLISALWQMLRSLLRMGFTQLATLEFEQCVGFTSLKHSRRDSWSLTTLTQPTWMNTFATCSGLKHHQFSKQVLVIFTFNYKHRIR